MRANRQDLARAGGRDVVIRGGRILDPSQGVERAADLLIVEGRVAALGSWPEIRGHLAEGSHPPQELNVAGLVVSPGFVDLHCHLRDPGFEQKETIASGAEAAVRGGFTTICCMPNTEPPLDSAASLRYVREAAEAAGWARVLPVACVSRGRAGRELAELAELAEAGAVGFSDDGAPVADGNLLRRALEYSALVGRPIIDHCEVPELAAGGVMHEGVVSARLGLRGVPAAAEEAAVARDIALVELTGGRLHLAHLSAAASVEHLRRAKEKGLAVTAEVTPHHLTMSDGWVAGQRELPGFLEPPGFSTGPLYDTMAKVNPPLRSPQDAEALLAALAEGTIATVATDHAPHTPVEKECEFDSAAFGMSGFETALGALMALVHCGRLSLATLVARLTSGPASLLPAEVKAAGKASSGTLAVGAVADVTVFDPNEEWLVDPRRFASKGKNTPLAGFCLRGRVRYTIVGGRVLYRGA